MNGQVQISLEKELFHTWSKFHQFSTEMIIVKEKGRKLFPRLEYVVRGLIPDAYYIAVLKFVRVDDHRYKYSAGEWQTNGKAEAPLPEQILIHPDGAVTGRQMMTKKLNFDYLRFTNNPGNTEMVILHSMHKYKPVLNIHQMNEQIPPAMVQQHLRLCPIVGVYDPDLCQFIAVTAYFNERIRNLKIEENKYAKGHKNDRFYEKCSPKVMKSVDSTPSPILTAFPTPNTSPQNDMANWNSMMKGMPYQTNPMMWSQEQLYNFNSFNFFQYPTQFNDMMCNPYQLFPVVPPYPDQSAAISPQ